MRIWLEKMVCGISNKGGKEMTALEAYILSRAYAKALVEGAGALKGAPCQIQSITPITGGNRITFAWENSEGETETDTLDVMDGVDGTNGTDGTDGTDGVGISSITFKEKDVSGNNVYTVTLTNTNTYDITCPIGPQGETGATGATGNGIASIAKTGTSGLVDTYTITYTNGQTTTFTVTNGESKNEFIGTLADWNALSTAQKKAYDTYQITDDYTGGSGLPNYSTSEVNTGVKWIDGKDIYRKVITNVVNETIIATNVDTIVNVIIARHGASTDNNRHVFGDGFTINDGGSIYINTTTHEAQYAVWSSTGGSLDKTADHIIIEYTKTT